MILGVCAFLHSVMLSVITWNYVKQSVIKLSVFMLNVVAPFTLTSIDKNVIVGNDFCQELRL